MKNYQILLVFLVSLFTPVLIHASDDSNGKSDRKKIVITHQGIPMPHIVMEPDAYYTISTATA